MSRVDYSTFTAFTCSTLALDAGDLDLLRRALVVHVDLHDRLHVNGILGSSLHVRRSAPRGTLASPADPQRNGQDAAARHGVGAGLGMPAEARNEGFVKDGESDVPAWGGPRQGAVAGSGTVTCMRRAEGSQCVRGGPEARFRMTATSGPVRVRVSMHQRQHACSTWLYPHVARPSLA